ncbi:hypothetical protein [Amycolatopsis pithecellobii]|uniref:Uncharacterized protein n=1 Tax=Amycolatopsis pithecellobii TaxID=664692 RepID=A0A6N7Z8C5_9PSEU|nr:hypothetical protein [Amycolatopsis pithecellobii]MTD57720.1 hypothetical protein [Amycolatopsis pithecellobii]
MTEGEPGEEPRQPSWYGRRLLGALAATAAAALAITGSFLPLVSGELDVPGRAVVTVSITGWKLTTSGGLATVAGAAQNGYPLAVSGAFLIIAAVLGLVAAVRNMPGGARALAVVSGAVAAAFLAGVVATIAVEAANLLASFQPAGVAGFGVHAELGVGFWLELAAVALAIAAVVLAALPVRADPGLFRG